MGKLVRQGSGLVFGLLFVLVLADISFSSHTSEHPYWGPVRQFFPGIGRYGILSHGGCLYLIWAACAALYTGAIWMAPAVPWRQTSALRRLGRLLITLCIGASVFVVFFFATFVG